MNELIEKLKNNYVVPLLVIAGLAVVLAVKTDFSLLDFVADRVVERMEGRYSPYGPQPPAQSQPSPQSTGVVPANPF